MKPPVIRGVLGRAHRPRGQTIRLTYYAVVGLALALALLGTSVIAAVVVHSWHSDRAPVGVVRAAQHNPYAGN